MKALFLDRDGIINVKADGDYIKVASEFVFIDEILNVLKHAKEMGYLLIMVSNQQGVGKGLMTQNQLEDVNNFMQEQLRGRLGYALDELYVCTDLEGSGSTRRKPAPGMLIEAIENNVLTPSACWFIGDNLSDALAGRAAGVQTILIGEFPPTAATVVVESMLQFRTIMHRIFI
ncbi:MAG: HAD-IIIA family hydrolase [Ignavibacteria bacterium]|nr:HAD-IIIA family hydrolase [Ignavibacteria bacterium]